MTHPPAPRCFVTTRPSAFHAAPQSQSLKAAEAERPSCAMLQQLGPAGLHESTVVRPKPQRVALPALPRISDHAPEWLQPPLGMLSSAAPLSGESFPIHCPCDNMQYCHDARCRLFSCIFYGVTERRCECLHWPVVTCMPLTLRQ